MSQPALSPEVKIALDGREGGGGALPNNGILETHSTQLCITLFEAAHSLYSLNRCFGNWILSFLNVYKMSTHIHLPPTFLSLHPWLLAHVVWPYSVVFASRHLTAWHYMAPDPVFPKGLGCEMHNQCNIHRLCIFFLLANIVQRVFFLFFCVFIFSSPFAFNLFVNMQTFHTLWLFIYLFSMLKPPPPPSTFFLHILLGL